MKTRKEFFNKIKSLVGKKGKDFSAHKDYKKVNTNRSSLMGDCVQFHLGMGIDNRCEADLPHLGIELKSCMNRSKTAGRVSVGESLNLTSKIEDKPFYESKVWTKCREMVYVIYRSDPEDLENSKFERIVYINLKQLPKNIIEDLEIEYEYIRKFRKEHKKEIDNYDHNSIELNKKRNGLTKFTVHKTAGTNKGCLRLTTGFLNYCINNNLFQTIA